MATLIMLIGLPGSGKSTYAKDIAETFDSYIVLSSDYYRKFLYGDENDQTHNQDVFSSLYFDMRKYLNQGKTVIFDATNINMKDRRRCFDAVKEVKNLSVMAMVVNTPFAECVYRDSLRERKVGYAVIDKMRRRFEFPQYFEGFNHISLVYTPQYDEEFRADIEQRMADFDQKNPWHNYTLGEHCDRVASQFDKSDVRYEAGKLHDIGKLYTQTFDEDGIAHYYNHENVGAYYVCTHLNLVSHGYDINELLFYINQHMHIQQIMSSEKASKKYRKLFGDKLYDNLVEFDRADKVLSR